MGHQGPHSSIRVACLCLVVRLEKSETGGHHGDRIQSCKCLGLKFVVMTFSFLGDDGREQGLPPASHTGSSPPSSPLPQQPPGVPISRAGGLSHKDLYFLPSLFFALGDLIYGLCCFKTKSLGDCRQKAGRGG
jgi:hypothetical protein